MSDLISRQEAIEYFVTNVGFHDEDGYSIDDSDELRKIWTEYFNGIPSAQPYTEEQIQKMQDVEQAQLEEAYRLGRESAQQWIPCSERLPEDGTIALVCGKKGGIRVARVFIPHATGNWDGDPNTNWWTIVGTGKSFFPIAWMPLPEPWKGEQQ